MKVYSITNWQLDFETSETRKLVRLAWWPKPNKHDGLGYRRLVKQRDKAELYAAWTLIGDIASKTTPKEDRGKLVRGGKPLTAADLADMTGFPEQMFERALEFFSDPEQGWLTVREVEQREGLNRQAAPVSQPAEPSPQTPAPGQSPGTPADSPGIPAEPAGTPAESPGGIEGREGKGEKGGSGREYPTPRFEQLPTPLFANTAHKMLRACDEQKEIVQRMAKKGRVPIMRTTAQGTPYQDGFKLPDDAEEALRQWDKRKEQISKALAG